MGAILWQFQMGAAALAYMYDLICTGISHPSKLPEGDYTLADTGA